MHSNSRRGRAAAAVVVIIAILAIAGGAVWYFVLRSTPEKAVATMLHAMQEGDQETLRSVLTERSQSFASMATGPMSMPLGEGEEAFTVGAAEVEGEQARVPVTFPLPEQVSQMSETGMVDLTYVVHREEGKWKVDLEDTFKAMMSDMMSGIGNMVKPGEPEPAP